MITESVLLGVLFSQIDKSEKLDKEATKKNVRAFTKIADANARLENCRKNLLKEMEINAKRKNGLLMCHMSMFQKQYDIIKKIRFGKGKGIEEIERLDEIQSKIKQYAELPIVTGGKMMKSSQYLVSFVFKGIGGMIVKESELNLKNASKNIAMANAVTAQTENICITLEGIMKHICIITELLEKLGMLYMRSIKNITDIIGKNGKNQEAYTDDDIAALNVSFMLTKLIYRIINTPLLDENGNIEKEALKVIQHGKEVLNQIQ